MFKKKCDHVKSKKEQRENELTSTMEIINSYGMGYILNLFYTSNRKDLLSVINFSAEDNVLEERAIVIRGYSKELSFVSNKFFESGKIYENEKLMTDFKSVWAAMANNILALTDGYVYFLSSNDYYPFLTVTQKDYDSPFIMGSTLFCTFDESQLKRYIGFEIKLIKVLQE